MAVTIKYKSLFETMLRYMPWSKLLLVHAELVDKVNELKDKENKTRKEELELENLIAQCGLIGGCLKLNKKQINAKCEVCGKLTNNFTLNMCEECFDKETDKYYDGGRDDE